MAVENRYPINRPLINSLPLEAPIFHRPEKSLRLKTKTNKKSLRLRHLVITFCLLVLFFVAVAELYYYAITCDQLRIKKVEVIAANYELKQKIESYLENINLGNILICDLNYLRATLSQLPGVKDVRLEKVLPSTLKAEIIARVPKVLVHKGGFYLVDEEAQVISSFSELKDNQFPILEDENNFSHSYEQKVSLACKVLDNFRPETRALIQKIIFTSDGLMEIYLADDPTRIILDEINSAEQLDYYLKNRASW
ncbi:MAG: cell division protein FtsQ/DivIB, partial [Candidatus Saccharicenans sp.]